jgi:hypothetical protein
MPTIARDPHPDPGRLADWRQLWAILLSEPTEQEKAAEGKSAAQDGGEVRRARVEQPPR